MMPRKWDPIEIDQNTYGIPLTQGKVALIDKEDLDKIRNFSWSLLKCGNNTTYAYAGLSRLMHRIILGVNKCTLIDHINHNGLDNRKINLRKCTKSQNAMNQRFNRSNTSGFRGVSLDKRTGKWQASVGFNSSLLFLGYYATAGEAKKVRDEKARELHGEFYNET